jgi:hypothetical protein
VVISNNYRWDDTRIIPTLITFSILTNKKLRILEDTFPEQLSRLAVVRICLAVIREDSCADGLEPELGVFSY